MKQLTNEQAIIISGYTGILTCPFSWLHADIEKRLGYPVWTHQLADPVMMEKIKAAYKDDFIKLCPNK